MTIPLPRRGGDARQENDQRVGVALAASSTDSRSIVLEMGSSTEVVQAAGASEV